MKYTGGCHCGAVRFEVEGKLADLEDCNCSICSKAAYIHWEVLPEQFKLLTPMSAVATYEWNPHRAKHYFCRTCGVSSFRVPSSDPRKININVRCLEGVDMSKLKIRAFDGRNWQPPSG
jgi:hypothetical protein